MSTFVYAHSTSTCILSATNPFKTANLITLLL